MNCKEFVDFLAAYLEHELPEERERIFREHMSDCPPCEVYLEQYSDAIRMGQLACSEGSEAPDDAPEELVQAILAATKRDASPDSD